MRITYWVPVRRFQFPAAHPGEIAPYLAAITALPDVDHMIIPVGKGLSLAYKT